MPRDRLCRVANVERTKHLRWVNDELLPRKHRYSRWDLLQAAALDEIQRALKPLLAARVWPQLRDDIGLPDSGLEVVVDLDTAEAQLVRTPAELHSRLPRGGQVVVIPVGRRMTEAQERLRAFQNSAPAGRAPQRDDGSRADQSA